MATMGDVKTLEIHAIVGFDGSALKGLKVHPEGEHVVYPTGNKVCIQEWRSKKMYFLSGHSNSVSTVDISPDGNYIGSGQINHIGFKAAVNIWDFNKKLLVGSHELHKVRVEAVSWSCDGRYLVSLGGRDDGQVVVWDCRANAAAATANAASLTTGQAAVVVGLRQRPNAFVTGGDSTLRVWSVGAGSKALSVVDVSLGKLRRSVRCLAVTNDDQYGYAGTTTGDLIKFSIKYDSDPAADVSALKPALVGCLAKCGTWHKGKRPESQCYSQGIEAILVMCDGCLVVGAGDGTVELLDEINWRGEMPKDRLLAPNMPYFRALKSVKLDGRITSLELMESPTQRGERRVLLAATSTSEIYSINVETFAALLHLTCHRCAINDIAFPRGMSGVFATGGAGSVRVWCTDRAQELLRIVVPNFVCSAVLFSADGKAIVSAWNDSCIRAFTPLTGRLIYCIYNTHNKGASALDLTSDGKTLISGGCEGQVRLWEIRPQKQSLMKVLKEHKSPVSAIQVSPNDREAVSAGTDGSCIIWDLLALSRRQVMYANTLFMCVCWEPSGCQLLTGGTDRRVAYWEVASGNLARELEASKTGAINGLHVSHDGRLFVTAGADQLVKLWRYHEGIYTHTGRGHMGAVTAVRFSPDLRYVVSACAAGTLVVWRTPQEYIEQSQQQQETLSPQAAAPPPPLPLGPAPRAPSRLPAAPDKTEQISAIDTGRSSVHSCCPCEDAGKHTPAAGDGSKRTPSQSTRASPNTKCCRPRPPGRVISLKAEP